MISKSGEVIFLDKGKMGVYPCDICLNTMWDSSITSGFFFCTLIVFLNLIIKYTKDTLSYQQKDVAAVLEITEGNYIFLVYIT